MHEVEMDSAEHSGTVTTRSETFRLPDLSVVFPDGVRGSMSHVGWTSTGLMSDVPDPERMIGLMLGDMELHDGMFVLMNPEEARIHGQSMINLADAAYRDKIMTEVADA